MTDSSYQQFRKFYTTSLLLQINLSNYIDRFAVAPLLEEIAIFFNVEYAAIGAIPTTFICSHLLFAPIFGRLGDRYSRKFLVTLGIILWTLPVIGETYLPDTAYWAFLVLTGIAGIGQASFVTIPPAIIADFYAGDRRSCVLMAFYAAIPIGSGLGYVISSTLATNMGSWQWGLRIPPFFGLVAAVAYMFSFDPPRGLAEDRPVELDQNGAPCTASLARVLSVPTYVYTTLGSAAVLFTVGAVSFWVPLCLTYVIRMNHGSEDCEYMSLVLGAITATGGIIGTVTGSFLARVWRKRDKRADCLVCAYSTLLGSIFSFLAPTLARVDINITYFSLFLTIVFLSFTWAVLPDIQLAVIEPENRALACGLQTMISHLFGDAASPYIMGAAADAFRGRDKTDAGYYYGFCYAFYIGSFVCVLGAVLYFVAVFYVEDDLKRQKEGAVKDEATSMDSLDYGTIE